MSQSTRVIFFLCLVSVLLVLMACKSENKKTDAPFEAFDAAHTGLHFSNKLTSTEQFNLFKYMYFYNGAGVGAADFNNDGLTDLFFASNQGDNKLYLNRGRLKFDDVTVAAAIPQDSGWSTGVSVVDINNDGLTDIYVCKVGDFESLKSSNQLLVCKGLDKNGVPQYKDEAAEYGLAFSGFSTQTAFFDYDADGDLDMYLLNHSIHQNANFAPRQPLLGKRSPVSGDRLYRNDGDKKFTDVTATSGINSSVIGYGLGIVITDVNLDGKPDIYIGNDFHENDYLYINQGGGVFKEELTSRMMHASKYSMGVDAADMNNDGFPEIISMDMLPYDPYIIRRSLGEEAYDLFNLKINYGYNYQYSRNNLQLNLGNGLFSEVGLYSGIFATDWSWAPLFFDFDNDGLKDLFISNGIPKRMNDIDFINYISTEDMQNMILNNRMDEINMTLIDKFPQIKIQNRFYRNKGELTFEDLTAADENMPATYSNGAAYADFDNDGDIDIVVNNIDEPALLYRNTANDHNDKRYMTIRLTGAETNKHAIGAKVVAFADGAVKTYDNYPVRGFMSSMDEPIHVGLHHSTIDSAFIIWPDNSYEHLNLGDTGAQITMQYRSGLPSFDYNLIKQRNNNSTKQFTDITAASRLQYIHTENPFNEFDRESLIPHMISTEGPAVATADINGDGLDDVFIGASKGNKPVVYIQQVSGVFKPVFQPALETDSTYEDTDAVWADVNNDKYPDLLVASGGNEYYGQDTFLSPRLYLNDGNGKLQKHSPAFTGIYVNASTIAACDFNKDGHQDVFVGGRSVPWEYGQIPRSYLMINDGRGNFRDVTTNIAPELRFAGMVTDANWNDIDLDGDDDLVICSEWGSIDAWLNDNGSFRRQVLTDKKGWWNFVLPFDIDNDGDIDLIAGNLGLNTRLKTSAEHPVRLYYADFDDNGKKEQVVTYYIAGKEIPFTNKMDLEKQMPVMKKKFLRAEDFAKSSMSDIFSEKKLEAAQVLTADYFSNAVLINDGNLNFSVKALPWQAQLSPYRDAVSVNANDDQWPDFLLGGNYFDNNIASGRNDADFGTILINKGDGEFDFQPLKGVVVKGQVRRIRRFTVNKSEAFLLVKNSDTSQVIRFKK